MSVMPRVTYSPMAIVRFIRVEMIEGLVSVLWKRTVVAMSRVVPVIHVTIEPVRTVKPGACTDEHPAIEPIWPVVPVGCAVVGWIVKVAIGA
jgi:hypothetical protein